MVIYDNVLGHCTKVLTCDAIVSRVKYTIQDADCIKMYVIKQVLIDAILLMRAQIRRLYMKSTIKVQEEKCMGHSWIELDAGNLLNNIRFFQSILGDSFAPVLKSNAYGHGISQVVSVLKDESFPCIILNYVSEADEVRGLGYSQDILVVGPCFEEDLKWAESLQVEVTISHWNILNKWLQLEKKPKIHIKINTGMNRQGFEVHELDKVANVLKPHKQYVKGVSTHFADVEDVNEQDFAFHQLQRFEEGRKAFCTKEGFDVMSHAAASAAALLLEKSRFDFSRIGISTYGVAASKLARESFENIYECEMDLRPVLSWRARVSEARSIAAGDYVGYGCTFQAEKNMNIAVLSVGYYEGYPRIAASSGAYVLIKGKPCPIVGRICMNMMMVDVSQCPDVCSGNVATLIGNDGESAITADDLADWSKTISYETLTNIKPHLPRLLLSS